ncbi:hypothetical protein RJ639_022544 [Escallonia herrerae]|uniref:Uncharacterized protein n=1 Tax=Escallonia herrerae TaxID=1293975 RepID=A0AA88V699_9ASTE|nr:hypothetical protein RJ639_022544 [Escallonia herrerae]
MAEMGLKAAIQFACTAEFWRMAVLWTMSLVVSYWHLFFTPKPQSYAPSSSFSSTRPNSPIITRPLCIITGATSGLGAAAAYALSREGFHVVLAGRSPHLLSKVISDIRRQNGCAHLKAFQVDLASFESILKFNGSLQQWLLDSNLHSSVQLLINNAGILATSCRLTAEGYDQVMATNYIGAFSLIKVLLPLLESSPIPSRIVNITSFTHRNGETVSENISCEVSSGVQVDKETVSGVRFSKLKRYPCAHVYEYSKLCLLLLSYELHRQFALVGNSVSVMYVYRLLCAVDPGAVKTNIMREVPSCLSQVAFLILKLVGLLQSPENGVCSVLDAALAPPEISGVYFFGGKGRTISSSVLSYNTELSQELWSTSCFIFQESMQASKRSSTKVVDS